ncbi:MAG TPA: hypothetical protein VG206_16875 [Terriglobia bacterium]|nr:hypothetical protein [Terriglobia bacterium]
MIYQAGGGSVFMAILIVHLLFGFLVAPPPSHEPAWVPIRDVLSASVPLDRGYRQMYNLEFEDAHRTFRGWEQAHPEDPLAFTSDGADYLFNEFDREGILQSDLFVDDQKFEKRKSPKPDPALKQAFDANLAKSDTLADSILKASPQDSRALFAKVLNLGLRGDYVALVQGHGWASLKYMKQAGALADSLLKVDPQNYDAYLAVGVENYMLGLSPAPVRWMLRLYGAQTNKNEGVEKLQLTATRGHYLLPFARLLLAVAAMRDDDRPEARKLLDDLAQAFPNNHLYQKELARLQ